MHFYCGPSPSVAQFPWKQCRPMMKSTTARLFIGLAIGLAAGLIFGWLRPVEYIDTSPNFLRADYRADYILMVAEAFDSDHDLDLAHVRLAALGPQPPIDMVVETIDYGLEHEFSRTDLEILNLLAVQLRTHLPSPEIGGP
jgi:hypothetical protein